MGKELRQGDPLSPLLYILVSEFLHLLVTKAEQMNIIKRVKFDQRLSISHLQLADDTIFFITNEEKSIMGIKVFLIIFQIMTGLKVNFHKSNLYSARSDCPDSQCMGIYAWMYTWEFFFWISGFNHWRQTYKEEILVGKRSQQSLHLGDHRHYHRREGWY